VTLTTPLLGVMYHRQSKT